MAGIDFTTRSVPTGDNILNGGLNTTGGPLSLGNNESPDLQNIDFNKFGSIQSRNGYTALNTSAITNTPQSDGLHWFEFVTSGVLTTFAINVADGKLFKMDDLDGTWDDITGGLTITAGNHCDFENFLNKVYITNNADPVFEWDGSGNGAAMTVPTGLTDARFVKQFNNFLFLANVLVSGTRHSSRIYWSNIKDTGTWTDTDFIDISQDDGQEITGFRVLSDRLVIFKSRSIYNLFFTGDSDVPFILPGGGKSNSEVGCVGGFSIQEVNNGLVFLSYDGFYFYDGKNSFKISERIDETVNGMNLTRLTQARSMVQKTKNRYFCSLPISGSTTNNRVLVWDFFNNAWSIYVGLAASSMATFYVSVNEERTYFGDYSGFVYRSDTGTSDNPLNVSTAFDSYYYTNWRNFQDLVDQKGVPQVNIYFQNSNAILTFAYSYNFENTDQFTQTFSLATSTDVYGTGVFGTATYAGTGGDTERRDLTGRGRVVRFKFQNSTIDETFIIDGFGTLVYLETNV